MLSVFIMCIIIAMTINGFVTRSSVNLKNNIRIQRLSENFTDGNSIIRCLNEMKKEKLVLKWNSTLLDFKPVSKNELYIVSRTSFQTEDYLKELLKGRVVANQDFKYLGILIAFIAGTSITIPSLAIPILFKNILGIFVIILPFIFLLTYQLFPNLDLSNALSSLKAQKNKPIISTDITAERICYHEAGHMLAGYLCGSPVLSYDINGESDAGLEIAIPDTISDGSIQSFSPMKALTGNLLVVAMSGVVSESLRFGDSKGGVEDIPVAYEVMRRAGIPTKEREGVLRWAVMKALVLLRIHRDQLDDVASAMMRSLPVPECLACIEGDNDI